MLKKNMLYIIFFLLVLISFSTLNVEALDDGDYTITSSKAMNKVVDLSGGIVKSKSNIQLYLQNESQAQTWHFSKTDDDYYIISSAKDRNYVLDVSGGNFFNRSNVQLFINNNSNAQKWKLVENADGYYNIVSYDSRYVLDISGGSTESGTNIQIFENNNSAAQKFAITKKVDGNETLKKGIYTISDINNSKIFLDESSKLKSEIDNNYAWYLDYIGNGEYVIRSFYNRNLVFDVTSGNKVRNTKIQIYEYNGSLAQKWIIKENNGLYEIISKNSGLHLIYNKDLYVSDKYDDMNNKFKIEKATNIFSEFESGNYTITTSIVNNKVLDLSKGTIASGNKIQLFQQNDSTAQQWIIEKAEDDCVYISSAKNTEYVLDVTGGNFNNGTKVQLYKKNNSPAQKWRILENPDGYFSIYSYNMEYVLDVEYSATANGTNIQIFQNNNSPAQKFAITKNETGIKTIEDGIYEIESNYNGRVLSFDNSIIESQKLFFAEKSNQKNQLWYIKSLNDGYYSINPLYKTNYVLDVAGGNKISNTKVQLFESNNSNAQKWIIKQEEDNYKIISKNSGMPISNINNNAIIFKDKNDNSSLFKINKKYNYGEKTIEDGYYTINLSAVYGKSLDIKSGIIEDNNNIQLYKSNSSLAQKWNIKYNDNGYYTIYSNKDSNYVLAYNKNSLVLQKYKENDECQQWVIEKNDSGYYIINKDYQKISVDNESLNDGTPINMKIDAKESLCNFKITPTANGISDNLKIDGYYFIRNAMYDDYSVDLSSGRTENGSNIQLYPSNNTKAQKWYLISNSSGYYTIKSGLSLNNVLDVEFSGTASGTNVQLYENNGSYSQQWVLKDAGNDYYYIVSNTNGLYLTAEESNGIININTSSFNGLDNQKFKFEKTRLENLVIDVSPHQGTIDWDTVKKDSGIYGVILRIAAGSATLNNEKERFITDNIKKLEELKIPYGIYLYSYAEDQYNFVSDLGYYHEAELEALRIINSISKYSINPKLGIYYDLEVWENKKNANWNAANYAAIINKFATTMHSYGYDNWRIYTNLSMANNQLSPWRNRITWIAQWSDKCSYDSYYNIWQYTSKGTIPGINGYVDLNYYYFD